MVEVIHISSETVREFCDFMHQLREDLKIKNIDRWFDMTADLINRYEETHRHYHDLGHIVKGLKLINETNSQFLIAKLAYVFHDVIYVGGAAAGMNEYASTLFAKKALDGLVDEQTTEVVYEMIMATSNHELPERFSGNLDELVVMLDVDLCGLGADYDTFANDTRRVVAELGSVSAEESALRNDAFARHMLAKDRIYHSYSFAHLEAVARQNLATFLR